MKNEHYKVIKKKLNSNKTLFKTDKENFKGLTLPFLQYIDEIKCIIYGKEIRVYLGNCYEL